MYFPAHLKHLLKFFEVRFFGRSFRMVFRIFIAVWRAVTSFYFVSWNQTAATVNLRPHTLSPTSSAEHL